MSLLKQREDEATQCVYAFSGMQHHYFGVIAGIVYGSEQYNLSFAELGTGRRHVIWDLRYIVSINGGNGLKPYNMELFLRWYPVVKLDFHTPGQIAVISVMAFLPTASMTTVSASPPITPPSPISSSLLNTVKR